MSSRALPVLRQLHKLPQRQKDLVFGYCHRSEQHETGQAIPVMMSFLILYYLGMPPDVFDPIHSSKKIRISNKGHSMVCYVPSKNCYLSNTVRHGRHVWLFRCISASENVRIGIMNPHLVSSKKTDARVVCIGYMMRKGDGSVSKLMVDRVKNQTHYDCVKKYACFCQNGDDISITVDFAQRSVGFGINGVEFGKAYDLDMDEYRAIICSASGRTAFKLLDYQQEL